MTDSPFIILVNTNVEFNESAFALWPSIEVKNEITGKQACTSDHVNMLSTESIVVERRKKNGIRMNNNVISENPEETRILCPRGV